MPDKLKVCLMNDSFPPVIDGVANAVYNYASIIQRELGESIVATPAYPGAEDDYPFPVARYPSLDTTRLVGYRAGVPFDPETLLRLEGEGIDIIHSHCPVTSTMLARILRERLNVPLVFTYHTKFDIDLANAVSAKFVREAAVRALVENVSACDEVWVVSRGAGENLRSLGYGGEYTVMENGVDLPKGSVSPGEIHALDGEFGLPPGVPVFLFVGRLMWYKGLRIILDALDAMRAEGRDFRMVFVGDGGDRAEVEAYARELRLSELCVFVGAEHDRERLRAWYCRADLLLFPSTFDTNGLVVREAAACGLPSLLVRGSCAAEGITDGRTGLLMDENAADMAAVLRSVWNDRDILRDIGCRAMDEIYVSWEDSVARAYSRYGAIVERQRSGGLPRRPVASDELLSMYGELLGGLERARDIGQSLAERQKERRKLIQSRLDRHGRYL